MTGRRLVLGFLVLIAALLVVAHRAPSFTDVAWAVMGLTSAAAIVVGVRLHRPRHRLPWWLLAGGLLAAAAGDAANVLQGSEAHSPAVSMADVPYLAGFIPLVIVAVLRLARSGSAAADRANLLDALVITSGIALLTWTLLVKPVLTNDSLTDLERIILIAYPAGGVLILITVARLAVALRWRPAVVLLIIGAAGMTFTGGAYLFVTARGGGGINPPFDLGWLAMYAGWGAAGLHRSMGDLTAPREIAPDVLGGRRLWALSVGALSVMVALAVGTIGDSLQDAVVAVLLTFAMLLMVLSRLGTAVGVQRRGLARESGLRSAGTALVATTSADEVSTVLQKTVRQILPPGTTHQVVLCPKQRGAGNNSSSPVSPTAALEQPDSGRAECVSVAGLSPELARRLQGADMVLACPLWLAGRAQLGTLYVAADEATLAALPETMTVLATQVAMALERIRLTDQVRRHANEEYFRTLVHHAADVILILDDDDTIRYASPSAVSLLGAATDVTGQPVDQLVVPTDRSAVQEVLAKLRQGVAHYRASTDWTMITDNGRRVQVAAMGRDLRADQTIAGLVLTLRDVTEQRRLERELTYRAYHDALTGLANRELFAERVTQALARSAAASTVVGVLFLDLDDLKLINDTMGHAVGDELLVSVTRRLHTVLPDVDLARLGGDEFAALVRDIRTPREAECAAERIIAAFEEPFMLAGQQVDAAVSVGVATTAEARDTEELLRQADLALYLAKGAGKAQWRRYEEASHDQAMRRMGLRAALSRALAEEAFHLDYQPIVALDTAAPVGVEALLRWEHPSRGPIGPAEFIAEAEDNGMIVPVGTWVLERALADAVAFCGDVPPADRPYLSVNVSPRQLRHPGFLPAVRAALQAAGMPPQLLVMEITEQVLLRDNEQVWADLVALRQLGVRVAIDDFGTGYSSLSYLRQAPIDIVKIERSFLDTIASSASQLAVVEGIVRLAHTLELAVIAEGIETEQDRDLLQAVGCQYGQGYLFSRPLSRPNVAEWLHAPRALA